VAISIDIMEKNIRTLGGGGGANMENHLEKQILFIVGHGFKPDFESYSPPTTQIRVMLCPTPGRPLPACLPHSSRYHQWRVGRPLLPWAFLLFLI
jgi:hypothetical protein